MGYQRRISYKTHQIQGSNEESMIQIEDISNHIRSHQIFTTEKRRAMEDNFQALTEPLPIIFIVKNPPDHEEALRSNIPQ